MRSTGPVTLIATSCEVVEVRAIPTQAMPDSFSWFSIAHPRARAASTASRKRRLAESVVAVLSVTDHVFAVRKTTEQPVDRPLVDPRTCRDLPEREPLGPRGRSRLEHEECAIEDPAHRIVTRDGVQAAATDVASAR